MTPDVSLPPPQEHLRILLVEDDAFLASAVEGALRLGLKRCRPTVVGLLEDALARVREGGVDVVMLDLGLPDSEGLDGLARIRAEDPQLPVIIMTGRVDEEMAYQALRQGAEDYLVKGQLDAQTLARSVRYALERRQARERLSLSQELFSATLNALGESIAILDADGAVLAVNRAWSASGAGPGAGANPLVHGCAPGTDYVGLCNRLVGEGHVLFQVALDLLDFFTGDTPRVQMEYQCPGPEGVRWYSLSASRFLHEEVQRFVVAHGDITRRKEAEAKVRRSEHLFRLITENAEDLIAIVDVHGRRLYSSPAYRKLLGWSQDELDGSRPLELLHPDDQASMTRHIEEITRNGQGRMLQYRLRHKDGEYRTFESKSVVLGEGPEGVQSLLIIAREITERLAAEKERAAMEVQLRQAMKLESIGQLAAGIAHEINTPIQYVGDNLRFLRDAFQDLQEIMGLREQVIAQARTGPVDPALLARLEEALERADYGFLKEEIPKAVAQALEGVGRVSRIVGAMKDFSHPGGEEKTLTDLNRAIESTLTVSRNEWKYVADLETDFELYLPPVPCYPGEFNQVVLNLVVNAAHAIQDVVGRSGAKGRIGVRTRRCGDRAEIRISDSGTGIPEAIRHRIFDPFFTTKPVGRGTGQGLAIAHSVIVEKHKGSLSFETELGKGTTFIISLPLEAEREEATA